MATQTMKRPAPEVGHLINFKLYGKSIGRGRLSLRREKATFTAMKQSIRELVLDCIHDHIWVYYTDFDKMLEAFQDMEYKEDLSAPLAVHQCWDTFTVRYTAGNFKRLTAEDFTEKQLSVMSAADSACVRSGIQNEEELYNSSMFTKMALLKDEEVSRQYYALHTALQEARYDDIYHSRTKEEWQTIYSARSQLVPYQNLWFERLDMFQTLEENLFYLQFKDNRDLDKQWGFAAKEQSKSKADIPLEYFPRQRSRPVHDYASVQYWVDNGLITKAPQIRSVQEQLDLSQRQSDARIRELLGDEAFEDKK